MLTRHEKIPHLCLLLPSSAKKHNDKLTIVNRQFLVRIVRTFSTLFILQPTHAKHTPHIRRYVSKIVAIDGRAKSPKLHPEEA